jgi:hypothetical protein
MSIPFTQFLRPDGRMRPVEFDGSPETERKAKYLILCNCRFEIEELKGGMVNMDCIYTTEDEQLACELIINGPGVPSAVESLVDRAYKRYMEFINSLPEQGEPK